MEDNNEDDLKNKEDLHIAGRHTALDIFRFAVFVFSNHPYTIDKSLFLGGDGEGGVGVFLSSIF